MQIRRQQAKDRAALTKQIDEAQGRIVKLQEEKAPFAADLRKVEAEVGPIKYIAALIYGDNPDENTLEKAVRWVIIIIVAVFDPLAVILLLASQYSFGWFRREQEEIENASKELPRSEEPVTYHSGPGATLPEQAIRPYPASEEDVEELILALEQQPKELVEEEHVSIDARVNNTDVVESTDIPVEPAGVDAPTEEKPKRQRRVKTPAPPGTPGEEWAASSESEQTEEDNLDKIYKASAEDLAAKQRRRGWFQAAFPKKDDFK